MAMPAMEQNDTGDSVTLGVGSDAGGETDAGKSITLSSFITGMGASMHWSMRGGYMHRDRQKKTTTVHQSEAALHPKPCQMEKSPKSVWLEVTVVRKEATN